MANREITSNLPETLAEEATLRRESESDQIGGGFRSP